MGDEGMVDGVGPSGEANSEHVVERAATSMRLRIYRKRTGFTIHIQRSDALGGFIVENVCVSVDCSSIQPGSGQAAVRSPT